MKKRKRAITSERRIRMKTKPILFDIFLMTLVDSAERAEEQSAGERNNVSAPFFSPSALLSMPGSVRPEASLGSAALLKRRECELWLSD